MDMKEDMMNDAIDDVIGDEEDEEERSVKYSVPAIMSFPHPPENHHPSPPTPPWYVQLTICDRHGRKGSWIFIYLLILRKRKQEIKNMTLVRDVLCPWVYEYKKKLALHITI